MDFRCNEYICMAKSIRELRTNKNIFDAHRAGDFQVHVVPNPQVNEARTKIPPVIHASLERTHAAGATHLRLFPGSSLDHHCQEVFTTVLEFVTYLKDRRREHSRMHTKTLTIQEKLGLVVHAFEAEMDTLAFDLLAHNKCFFV